MPRLTDRELIYLAEQYACEARTFDPTSPAAKRAAMIVLLVEEARQARASRKPGHYDAGPEVLELARLVSTSHTVETPRDAVSFLRGFLRRFFKPAAPAPQVESCECNETECPDHEEK